MVSICKYRSPLGDLLLAADEEGLTGLWFVGQKYYAHGLPDESIWQETKILTETRRWLDIYFSGEEPKFTPPLHPVGTAFRQAVWKILLQIPYGQTVTYGEIAQQLAAEQGFPRCLHRLSEGRLDTIKYRLSFPVIELLVQMEA